MDEEEEVGVRTTARAEERKSGRVILNTWELTEQIHLPTLSLSLSFPFYPPPSSAFCSFSLSPSHLFLLAPPTPLISSKSSYIPSSSSSSPSLPTFTKKFDLNEQMKRGGEQLHRGSPGRARSALCGSAFVYSGLPHVKLSDSLFAIIFFCRRNY